MLQSARSFLGRIRHSLQTQYFTTRMIVKDWLGLTPHWTSVVSYPKTGRTWLRALISKALIEHHQLDPDLFLNTGEVSRQPGLPKVAFTHDSSELRVRQSYQKMGRWKGHYRHHPVIFVIRNPFDVMVSCYFQAHRREGIFQGTISEFIRSDELGIRKYLRFVSIWYRARRAPEKFLLIAYEDLHSNANLVMRQIMDFIGAEDVTDETIAGAVEFARFENLRKLESQGKVDSDILQPGDSTDAESFKVRRGVVEGYRDYLSEDDIQYIQRELVADASPFLERYLAAEGDPVT